MILALNIYFSI